MTSFEILIDDLAMDSVAVHVSGLTSSANALTCIPSVSRRRQPYLACEPWRFSEDSCLRWLPPEGIEAGVNYDWSSMSPARDSEDIGNLLVLTPMPLAMPRLLNSACFASLAMSHEDATLKAGLSSFLIVCTDSALPASNAIKCLAHTGHEQHTFQSFSGTGADKPV